MIQRISIKNFRSIEAAEIELAPITILYGPTSAGKSTLFYAALALRNFVLNPNRQADAYFHLGFMDLGGFDACVFNHDAQRMVGVVVALANDGAEAGSYGLELSKTEGTVRLVVRQHQFVGKVAIPYGLNQSFASTIEEDKVEYTVNWNGITSTVAPKEPTAETQARAQAIAVELNQPAEALKGIDIAPHRRGFFKSNYTPAAISTTPTTEDEVASIIINDQYMPARISQYTEEIFDRDFRLSLAPGTSTVFFQSTDKKARLPTYLVNDGFGVNQVVYLLAKMHRPEVDTLFVEEPEVHLHPTALRNFARAICRFAIEEGKQLVFTTHSDRFVSAILAVVAEGSLHARNLRCYLSQKQGRSTTFEPQTVHSNGQIDGGLTSFVEAEMQDMKTFMSPHAAPDARTGD